MRRTLFLILVNLFVGISAQGQIVLKDAESGRPIEGAFVKIQTLSNGEWDYFVSTKQGVIPIEAGQLPASAWISHLSFTPWYDTLRLDLAIDIRLQPSTTSLEPVVITGQYEPQSAEQSVYKIRAIDRTQIAQRGAKNIEDVLTTSLNVRLQNDPATGTSSVSLQGISGENVKVLIDGVPIIGRVDGQIDINQIDVNQVERIEIVEGPMAVNYGSNAMGGLINIITKKNDSGKWNLGVTLTEESAGSEYGGSQGGHNQSITGGYNFSQSLYGQLGFTHNYFGGYYGDSPGRSTLWDPKTQLLGSALLRFGRDRFSAFYKLDALNELIENRGEPSGLTNPVALDEEYETERFIHQVQTGYKISSLTRFNAIFSFTDFRRTKRQFVKNLTTGEKPLSTAQGSQDTTYLDAWNFRGSVTKLTRPGNLSFDIGYDINLESGQGGRIEGTEVKSINDFALYGSMEIGLGNWKIRPGLRASANSVYETPLVPSINSKWNRGRSGFRAAYGRGFRAPSLKELHLEFVDSNHRVFGNPSLMPEDGHHFDAGWSLTNSPSAANRFKYAFDVFYNSLRNKIDFGQDPTDPTATTYINIEEFQSLGANLTGNFHFTKMQFEAGAGLIGRKDNLVNQGNDFLTSPEFIFNYTFFFSPKVSAGMYYKYTGAQPRYVLGVNPGDPPTIVETDSFNWLDLTGSFAITQWVQVTAGIKNLLDVKNINSGGASGTHSSSTIPVSYGRSAFVRAQFSFNSK